MQTRSRERADAILLAAARAFVEPGFDAATMEGIAASAETSIGSVYQFFANKPALLAAISDRYVAAAGALIDELLTPAQLTGPWRESLGALVDGFALLDRSELFRPIRRNWHVVQTLPGRGLALHRAFAERAGPFFEAHFPGAAAAQRMLLGTIVAESIAAMLFLAARMPAAESAPVIEHAKELVVRFLAPYSRKPAPRRPQVRKARTRRRITG